MIESPTEREYAEYLYKTYEKLMRHIIFQIVHDRDKADDLLQDAMCRLFSHLEKLQDWSKDHVRGYACRTARSVALNEVDPKRRKQHYLGEVESLTDEATPEDVFIKREEIKIVRGVLDELPERERDLLYFKYFEEMDNQEIARLLSPLWENRQGGPDAWEYYERRLEPLPGVRNQRV